MKGADDGSRRITASAPKSQQSANDGFLGFHRPFSSTHQKALLFCMSLVIVYQAFCEAVVG